ncbi:MAG: hypothetical protein IJH18_02225 [Bacilli bacterium]|nr:hypothetical protein [Bacilli bacterium]
MIKIKKYIVLIGTLLLLCSCTKYQELNHLKIIKEMEITKNDKKYNIKFKEITKEDNNNTTKYHYTYYKKEGNTIKQIIDAAEKDGFYLKKAKIKKTN